MRTLILVDIQNDFLPGGALAVPRGDEVIAVANRLQPAFDLVVATQDWHPAGHGSFASTHPGRKPGHCLQGTLGAAFAPALKQDHIAKVFQKGTDPGIDSYSGFFDNGHRKSTGLGDYLKGRGATAVYILGLTTDYCAKFTALDSRHLGFRTFLIEDATRGVELQPGDVARAIEEMRSAGVEVVRSHQLRP